MLVVKLFSEKCSLLMELFVLHHFWCNRKEMLVKCVHSVTRKKTATVFKTSNFVIDNDLLRKCRYQFLQYYMACYWLVISKN